MPIIALLSTIFFLIVFVIVVGVTAIVADDEPEEDKKVFKRNWIYFPFSLYSVSLMLFIGTSGLQVLPSVVVLGPLGIAVLICKSIRDQMIIFFTMTFIVGFLIFKLYVT